LGLNFLTGFAILALGVYLLSMSAMSLSAWREFAGRPHPFLPRREPPFASDGQLARLFNSRLFHPKTPRL